MATISVAIPDALVPRVKAAYVVKFSDRFGAPIDPATIPARIKEKFAQEIRQTVIEYEAGLAANAARTSTETQTISDVSSIS